MVSHRESGTRPQQGQMVSKGRSGVLTSVGLTLTAHRLVEKQMRGRREVRWLQLKREKTQRRQPLRDSPTSTPRGERTEMWKLCRRKGGFPLPRRTTPVHVRAGGRRILSERAPSCWLAGADSRSSARSWESSYPGRHRCSECQMINKSISGPGLPVNKWATRIQLLSWPRDLKVISLLNQWQWHQTTSLVNHLCQS